jgi:hypothetical protein
MILMFTPVTCVAHLTPVTYGSFYQLHLWFIFVVYMTLVTFVVYKTFVTFVVYMTLLHLWFIRLTFVVYILLLLHF